MFKIACKYVGFRYRQYRRRTNEKIVVETVYGPVRGVKRISCWNDTYYSFERIPFAKPPVGELRFSEPQPPEPWTEVLDCTSDPPKPVQTDMMFKRVSGEEDCLFVSVFTREVHPEKLKPVMVWIHGGAFVVGSTSRDMASPDYLLSKDVVMVSVAYRLGIFGFLCMDDPKLQVPGNAGLKDQVIGLRWVQQNISKFGGDPNNVTLFGVSAGAGSVHLLALSKQTEGLFHRVICMSGTAFSFWAHPPRKNWSFRIAKQAGYNGTENDEFELLKFLRDLNPKKLSEIEASIAENNEKYGGHYWPSYPVIEPYATEQCLIPEDPVILARKTWSNKIPMILGGTAREGIFMAMVMVPGNLEAWENKPSYMLPFDLKTDRSNKDIEELGKRLMEASFKDGKVTMEEYIDFTTISMFWHGIRRTVQSRLHYGQAPTYVYNFDFDSPEYGVVKVIGGLNYKGASHGDDIGYMFVNMMTPEPSPDSNEDIVTRKYVAAFTQFAKNGDPNCKEIEPVEWKPEKAGEAPKCLKISKECSYVENPFNETLNFWDQLYGKDELY